MAQPAAVAAQGGGGSPAGGRQQQGGFGQSLTGIIRMAVMWYFAMKFFSPKKPSEPSTLINNIFHKGEPLVSPTLQTLALALALSLSLCSISRPDRLYLVGIEIEGVDLDLLFVAR